MTEGRPSIPLKSIALPAEHGGWGFLFEPILLGLLVAPSAAGGWLSVGALGAFLARHPLKLALNDLLRRRRSPRLGPALGWAAGYGVVTGAGFGLAFLARDARLFLPLLAAAPLAMIQLHYDARNRGRDLVPQSLGALAPGALASAVLMAGGWPLAPALLPWLLLALKSAASILYVRARLRLDRGSAADRLSAWISHGVAVSIMGGLALAELGPWLAVAAFGVLTLRALVGLSALRRPVRPQSVGFQEIGYGLLTVLLLAAGYRYHV